jgi:hypothetical protein
MEMIRQQVRAEARDKAFHEVTGRYGLEPRKARRAIARALVRAWWKRGARPGESFLAPIVSAVGSSLSAAAIISTLFCVAGISAPPARAQASGSRKDDVVLNARGLPLAGATIRVCTAAATGAPCSPLALIYSDEALTQALANPTTSDGMGNYSFYAVPGRYMIEISGPGITTRQIPDVILPSDPSAPTFTSLTTTSGIDAFSLTLSGNLTVSGSAAITGALTVNGGPVPSTGAVNTWTASQYFKGPVPWRDCTAFGYVGNGSHDDGPAINSCIAAAEADPGGTIYIPWTASGGFINTCLTPAASHGAWLTIKIAAPLLQWGSGCATQNWHTNYVQLEGIGAGSPTSFDNHTVKATLRNYNGGAGAPFFDIFGTSLIFIALDVRCGNTTGTNICVNVDNNGTTGSSANVDFLSTNVESSGTGVALQFTGMPNPGGFLAHIDHGVFGSGAGCTASVKVINWGLVTFDDDFFAGCNIYFQYLHPSTAPAGQLLIVNAFTESGSGPLLTLDSDTTSGAGIFEVEIDQSLQADGTGTLVTTKGVNVIQDVIIRGAFGASPNLVDQHLNPVVGLHVQGSSADSSIYQGGGIGEVFSGNQNFFWAAGPTNLAVGTVRGSTVLCNGSLLPPAGDAPLHVIDCTNGGNGISVSSYSPGLVERLDSANANPSSVREFPVNGTWSDLYCIAGGCVASVDYNSVFGIWSSRVTNGVDGSFSGQDIGGFAKGFSTSNDIAFERGGGNRIRFTGTPTADRTVTFQDAAGTVALTSQLPFSGTASSIGGGSLAAGACTSGTASVTGATTSMVADTSPAADPGAGFTWNAFVSASGTVTVRVCNVSGATATPTAAAYNVRVIQ